MLKALMDTNLEQLPGYGTDKYSESAKEKIRAACECPDADVEFLVGGTQTNAVVISTLLKDYEGVIAADTGHVSTHEAGAIEHSGHKVLALPHVNGKLEAQTVKEWVERFYADGNHEHMVFPGMVYISHPTEYGTLYSKAELDRAERQGLPGAAGRLLHFSRLQRLFHRPRRGGRAAARLPDHPGWLRCGRRDREAVCEGHRELRIQPVIA